jgi:hypothetical protein
MIEYREKISFFTYFHDMPLLAEQKKYIELLQKEYQLEKK